MATKDQSVVRASKKRGRKKEEIHSKKMIMEMDTKFRITFPEENREVYLPEIMAIAGATESNKIPFNPEGKIPEPEVTFLCVFNVPKSEENLQTVARFGKSHRFDFDSDLAVRAFSSSAEGKALEKMSFARRASSNFTLPKLGGFSINSKGQKKADKPYEFQPAGIEYMLRAKKCFLADEMGLGKSFQAIGGMAVVKKWPWLLVVPANLKYNWAREIKRWLKPVRFQGKSIKVVMLNNKHLSKTPKGNISKATKQVFAEHQIVIVNYDRVEKYLDYLRSIEWTGIVFDESHYLKALNSHRSKACRALVEDTNAEYVWMLSGTPLMNRPVEIAGQLRIMGRLGDFGGFNNFVRRYCSFTTPDPKLQSKIHAIAKAGAEGTDATEITLEEEAFMAADPLVKQAIEDAMTRKLFENMVALNKQLRSTCYIRREKSEVLKDLPAKTRTTLPLEITNRKLYEKIEADVCSFLADQAVKDEKFLASIQKMSAEQKSAAIRERRNSKYYASARAEALVRLQNLKFAAAIGKLAAAKEWISNFLEQGQKLVVFAHHIKIVDELIDAFPEAAHTKGGLATRDAEVERFQKDDNCRLFIGSLKRDGVGLTLTASHATAFLELGWTPAAHDQAEDRVHRIGQEDAVTAYYLLAKGTVEETIAKLIENKRQVVNAVADGDPLHNMSQGSIVFDLVKELTGKDSLLGVKGPVVKKVKKAKKTVEAAA